MIIGDRLRALREEKKLSQGDISKAYRSPPLLQFLLKMAQRSGIENSGKLARALECPRLSTLLRPVKSRLNSNLPKRKSSDISPGAAPEKEAR